jgi:hypothetical protein
MSDSKARESVLRIQAEAEENFTISRARRRYMNASHDRGDSPNIDARSLWLAQVSEAATALAGTRVPDQFSDSLPNVSFQPVVDGKSSSLSVRLDDSLNPNVLPVSSDIHSNLGFAKVGGLLIVLALTAGSIASQIMDRGIWEQLLGDTMRIVQSRISSALGVISIGSEKPRLIVQHSRATSGEPAPLGLTLYRSIDGAVVHIEGLVRGMELSVGRAVGFDSWEVPADAVGDAWIAPPDGFAGSVNLVAELRRPGGEPADRQKITVEWASPIAPVPVARKFTESTTPKPPQLRDDQNYRTDALSQSPATPQSAVGEESPISLAPTQHQPAREEAAPEERPPTIEARWKKIDTASSTLLEPIQLKSVRKEMPAELSEPASQREPSNEELASLLKRGKDLIATGDLVAARLTLRRAAEANNAEAALALGATYDPLVLRQLNVYGLAPDAAMARSWYEKAAKLGSSSASRRLEMLTERMGTR